tara:strand:- start:363 stop:1070 length:708 start_codon:yes stop_codon:yes gene_type:complete
LNRICLINHWAGIGDIFYLQSVAKKYISMGYEIIWPLRDDILWLGDYIKGINFCSRDDNFPGKEYYGQDAVIITPNFVYLGIMRPHLWGIGDGKIMSSKYSILNMNHSDWRSGFTFDRKLDKEENLYYNVLGLKDDSEFVFINNLYNENRNCEIMSSENYDLPVVELQYIEGFTLLDWCKVFEKAKSVYTINTSLNYIIDMLDTSYEEYVIVAHDEQNKIEIDYLFNTPHKMICK